MSTRLLAPDFPPASYDEWRRRVESELGGAPFAKALASTTPEGWVRQPLYTAGDLAGDDPAGFPGLPPFTRGPRAFARGWTVAQEVRGSTLDEARTALAADLDAGVELVWLARGPAFRSGAELEALLAEVDLERIAVVLDAGPDAVAAAALFLAAAARRGVAFEALRGGFGCDPLAALAAGGTLPGSLEQAFALAADLAAWSRREAPGVRPLLVDVSPYHEAGASAVEELAFAAASGVELLRRLTAAGHGVDAVAAQTLFAMSVGGDLFLEIAKLRAARLLWAKVVRASGGSQAAQAMRLHARTSTVTRALRDPWVNLLRGTAESFAAAAGGADSIAIAPFDELLGTPEARSRRIAVNTQHVLREEAYLEKVLDPAGGSYYVEKATDELARAAWELFREIERRGGMARCLTGGWVGERIAATAEQRRRDAATRKAPVVGVSEFPNLADELPRRSAPDPAAPPPERGARPGADAGARLAELSRTVASAAGDGSVLAAAIAAAEAGATLAELEAALWRDAEPTVIATLPPFRAAQPFEALRARSDCFRAAHGRRPRVYLARIGGPADYRARAAFATNFFAAGGIEAVGGGGFAVSDELARELAEDRAELNAGVVVLCSADELYPDVVPRLAPALKESGARVVILAGAPGEHEAAWRAVGVDQFIYLGCDVVAVLEALWAEVGDQP